MLLMNAGFVLPARTQSDHASDAAAAMRLQGSFDASLADELCNYVYFAPDGTVLPCQSWLEGPGLGNLLTDDWSGIWDGEPCRRIRAESAKMEHICQLQQEGGC